jgi:2-iminoacetate synthase
MKISTEGVKSFIPTAQIEEQIVKAKNAPASQIKDIIDKSLSKQRLDPMETAALLSVTDPELRNMILEGAHELKERIYGNRNPLCSALCRK